MLRDFPQPARDTVSTQGEYYQERTRGVLYLPSLVAPPTGAGLVQHDSGGHALMSWNHRFAAGSDVTLKAYFDTATTQDYTASITVRTYDVEMVDRLRLGPRNELIWGSGFREVDYATAASRYLFWTPPSGGEQIFNAFAQDDFTLTRTLHLIGGIKVEHNTYTGWENEPSVRLIWEPNANHTVWAAVSQAIRVPSIGEEFGRINIAGTPATLRSPPVQVAILGNPALQKSERLTAYEAGYRGALTPRLSVDLSAFYNRYADMTSTVPGAPRLEIAPGPPHLLVPLYFGNLLRGDTYGGEMSAKWRVTPNWDLAAGYSLLRGKLVGDNPALTLTPQPNAIGTSPRHQIQARSHMVLPWRTELDVAVYRVASVPSERVDAYTRLDLRLGWRPNDHLSFSLAGQNLLQSRHQEFLPVYFATALQVPRTVYLTATLGF